ncbi:hypothetical protein [Frankia sp. R43]|uniref:hypothetical protein n=1 Tax=Frankia sp. R43 TaxID=269536 RepID=UPI001F3D6F03|nr:hypothetical protein [Frankia sp. R43]
MGRRSDGVAEVDDEWWRDGVRGEHDEGPGAVTDGEPGAVTDDASAYSLAELPGRHLVPSPVPSPVFSASASAAMAMEFTQPPGGHVRPLPAAAAPGSHPVALVPPATGQPVPVDHPLVAANRYRELMGASDTVRALLAQRLAERQEGHDVLARRHRAAAEDIRSRVAVVWSQVGGSLESHGLDGLDQLRPREGTEPDVEAVYQQYAGDLDGLGSGRGRGGRGARAAVALPGEKRLGAAASIDGGGIDGRGKGGRGRSQAPADGLVGADDLVDPERARKLAYRLCLEVMSRSAELRAVTKGVPTGSSGLIVALVCVLAGALTVAARVFGEAPALPCLVAAGALGAVAVVASADASAVSAARSALLAAGSAGVAVLATFRFVPIEPAGTIGALACLALAMRFGLGVGAGASTGAGAGPAGGGRSRRS